MHKNVNGKIKTETATVKSNKLVNFKQSKLDITNKTTSKLLKNVCLNSLLIYPPILLTLYNNNYLK